MDRAAVSYHFDTASAEALGLDGKIGGGTRYAGTEKGCLFTLGAIPRDGHYIGAVIGIRAHADLL